VQINVGHLDENGVYTGKYTTLALRGYVRAQVMPETCPGPALWPLVLQLLRTVPCATASKGTQTRAALDHVQTLWELRRLTAARASCCARRVRRTAPWTCCGRSRRARPASSSNSTSLPRAHDTCLAS